MLHLKRLAMILLAVLLLAGSSGAREPAGGKPPEAGRWAKVDLAAQVKYQRAFSLVLWSVPAIEIYGFKRGITELGGGPNTILAWSRTALPKDELLTANNTTPYIIAMTDLRRGPVVVEVPASSPKIVLYGQIIDHWQRVITDIGPSGRDRGRGGKYLLLPPDYKGEVPAGYFACSSPSHRVYLAFRSIRRPGADAAAAEKFSRRLKMYYLDKPEPTRFIDPAKAGIHTLARFDERWFKDLGEILAAEKPVPEDRVMRDYLAALGIEPGKPWRPDGETVKTLRRAAADAWFYLHRRVVYPEPEMLYWPDRHWQNVLTPDLNGAYTFDYADRLDIDARAERYFLGTFFPGKYSKKPAALYLFSFVDHNNRPLEAGRTYALTIPARVPAKYFWSLIIYDAENLAFIYTPQNRQGLSSLERAGMKTNPDGSVTLYFGPKPPPGLENNWIPTAGKIPFPVLRFYGPKKRLLDKSWKVPDVVPVSGFE